MRTSKKAGCIYQKLFFLLLTILISFLPAVSASPENISIISPANDNSIYTEDFPLRVYVNDTNVRYVQVRTAGASWMDLEQVTSTEWAGTFHIASYQNGNYILTAKYLRNGESLWNYVASTTTFQISKPDVTLELSIKDENNYSLQGAVISPGGNVSDSAGRIRLGGLTINTVYNYIINKTSYFEKSFQYVPTTYTGYQTIQLTKKSSTALKKLKITGISSFAEVNTMFNLRVRDAETDAPIYGAQVKIYEGLQVISIPGTTSSTGRITASFTSPGEFELVVEQEGYEEYSETVTVIAPRTLTTTPTPTVSSTSTPTPVPTVKKTFRPDVGAEITDDDYRAWFIEQEKKNITTTITSLPTAQPPTKPQEQGSIIPGWGVLGVGGLLLSIYLVNKVRKNGKESEKTSNKNILDSPGGQALPSVSIIEKKPPTIILKCAGEKCEWVKEVPASFTKDEKQALVDLHYVKEHKE